MTSSSEHRFGAVGTLLASLVISHLFHFAAASNAYEICNGEGCEDLVQAVKLLQVSVDAGGEVAKANGTTQLADDADSTQSPYSMDYYDDYYLDYYDDYMGAPGRDNSSWSNYSVDDVMDALGRMNSTLGRMSSTLSPYSMDDVMDALGRDSSSWSPYSMDYYDDYYMDYYMNYYMHYYDDHYYYDDYSMDYYDDYMGALGRMNSASFPYSMHDLMDRLARLISTLSPYSMDEIMEVLGRMSSARSPYSMDYYDDYYMDYYMDYDYYDDYMGALGSNNSSWSNYSVGDFLDAVA